MSPGSHDVKEAIVHDGTEVLPEWKKELNERLAATRLRRLRIRGEQVALPGLEPDDDKVQSRAAKLAAKVARRYANAPSYRDVLAAEAQARTVVAALPIAEEAFLAVADVPPVAMEAVPEAYRPEEFGIVASAVAPSLASPEASEEANIDEPVAPLPTNVLDFPRELVAPRKMRPRLAEGPLSSGSQKHQPQLKIFEVPPEAVSQQVNILAARDWSPIRLDAQPVHALRSDSQPLTQDMPFKTASLEDRMMAAIFDLSLIVAAFALFVLVFIACTSHPPTGRPALMGAGGVLVGFCLLYQYLFFRFAAGTPGMRYAKIALCTFEDENPTRKAMCRRVWFQLLSAAPLGLGFAWAWFDADRMGWHDRMSRIYQRSYS